MGFPNETVYTPSYFNTSILYLAFEIQLLKLTLLRPESPGLAGNISSRRECLVRLETKPEWVLVGLGSGAWWAVGPVSSQCRGEGKTAWSSRQAAGSQPIILGHRSN